MSYEDAMLRDFEDTFLPIYQLLSFISLSTIIILVQHLLDMRDSSCLFW